MTGGQSQLQAKETENMLSLEVDRGVLPDLCSTAAVLSLVLVGELLAFALVLVSDGIGEFSWAKLGLVSMLIQWVLLASAGTVCTLRKHINRLGAAKAVSVSYAIVLIYTVIFSMVGLWFDASLDGFSWHKVLTNVLIAAIFAGVLFRYLYLQQCLKQQEQAALGARVQALQSRIRPHFLFNSLNSIASLIAIKPELAEKTVIDLSQLFRASLQLPQLTPIEQELELCRCFADIERVRLGDRLNVVWTVEDVGEGVQILNLLLQPLLENAIYHGIQPLTSGGQVDVEVKKVASDIVLRITNPRLPGSEMQTHHNPGPVSSGNGIALSNIRRRLEAFYGKRAYLRIVKGETDFTVIVRYPAE